MLTGKFKLTDMHGDRGMVVHIPEPRKPVRAMSLRELFYHSNVGQIVEAIKAEGVVK